MHTEIQYMFKLKVHYAKLYVLLDIFIIISILRALSFRVIVYNIFSGFVLTLILITLNYSTFIMQFLGL
jgi:hypothetical protein